MNEAGQCPVSRLNIGPVVRAKKWRRLYARGWFVLLLLSVFAILYLTDHRVTEILFRLPPFADRWATSPGPGLLAFVSVILVYTTATVFLLCKTRLRVNPAFFLTLGAFYLAFLLRPLFSPPYVRAYGGNANADTVDLMSKAFALPGLVASLFASWNEIRFRAAAKSLLSASDFGRVQTFKRTKRPKVNLPPGNPKSSEYKSFMMVTLVGGFFVTMLLLIAGFGPVAGFFTYAVLVMAGWMYYLAHKHNVRTVDEVARVDSRRPVLILRSFKSDKRLSQTGGRPFTSLIDRFAKLLGSVGPPIALPEPKVPLPFAGVAVVPVPAVKVPAQINEAFAEFNDWKEEFARRIEKSGLIVMFVSDSSGLLWELRELLARSEAMQRTVLVFTEDLKARQSRGFLNFLGSLEGPAMARKLYGSILDSQGVVESWLKPASQITGPDRLLPRKYRADMPLLVRFASSGDPTVITGPLVWEGYEEAFMRYVLAG